MREWEAGNGMLRDHRRFDRFARMQGRRVHCIRLRHTFLKPLSAKDLSLDGPVITKDPIVARCRSLQRRMLADAYGVVLEGD